MSINHNIPTLRITVHTHNHNRHLGQRHRITPLNFVSLRRFNIRTNPANSLRIVTSLTNNNLIQQRLARRHRHKHMVTHTHVTRQLVMEHINRHRHEPRRLTTRHGTRRQTWTAVGGKAYGAQRSSTSLRNRPNHGTPLPVHSKGLNQRSPTDMSKHDLTYRDNRLFEARCLFEFIAFNSS